MPIPKWCDRKTIRTIKRGKTSILICCPKKKWKRGRCSVGTKKIEVKHFGGYIHSQAARVLGWPVRETERMSLQSLRELVRPLDAKLAETISDEIRSGRVVARGGKVTADMSWLGPPPPKSRGLGEYLVRYTVTHDRPENRGATFGPVRAGTKTPKEDRVASRKIAIALYNEIIRGDMDSSADFVSSAQVLMPRKTGGMITVRPFVFRKR